VQLNRRPVELPLSQRQYDVAQLVESRRVQDDRHEDTPVATATSG